MDIKEAIEKFKPFNEQEVKDKEMLLKYLASYEDLLTRNNETMHFTCSSLIVNERKDKALMIHHNIFNSWSLCGGHADGDKDFLGVALKEAKEESSLSKINVLDENIFSLEIIPVLGHFKRGEYVSGHLHLSVVYLFQASEQEEVKIKPDENSGVAWFPIDEVVSASSEPHMQVIYQKLIDKLLI